MGFVRCRKEKCERTSVERNDLDLLGQQVQVMFATMASSIEFIRAGKLRPLAVTATTRSAALPAIPTMSDFLPGYEASDWYGIVVPANTQAAIVEKLDKEIGVTLADPGFQARLTDLGGAAMPMTPADFGKFIAQETEKWAKVIRAANIKA
jgi:tripartite-type tricarboxylate transporter receptor subunit TctC